jgi:hypothetical protein
MRKIAVFLSVILSFAGAAESQVNRRAARTVTNADLERYRSQRLNAERDYRENYERLGFPSPEELDRQLEQSRIEREELSAKLREDRLERERINAEALRAQAELAAAYNERQAELSEGYQPFYGYGGFPAYGYGSYYGGNGGLGYGSFYGGFGHRRFRPFGFGGIQYVTLPGYRATPAGVFDSPVRVPIFTSAPRAWRR